MLCPHQTAERRAKVSVQQSILKITHLATVFSPADFQLLSSDMREVIEEFYNFSAGEVICFHLMLDFELAVLFSHENLLQGVRLSLGRKHPSSWSSHLGK